MKRKRDLADVDLGSLRREVEAEIRGTTRGDLDAWNDMWYALDARAAWQWERERAMRRHLKAARDIARELHPPIDPDARARGEGAIQPHHRGIPTPDTALLFGIVDAIKTGLGRGRGPALDLPGPIPNRLPKPRGPHDRGVGRARTLLRAHLKKADVEHLLHRWHMKRPRQP